MMVPSKDVGSIRCQASAGVPGTEAAIMTAPDAGTQTAPLDDVDRAIVAVLREDGRISMRALAARLHISRAGVYLRVQRLEEAGVITGYSARVDPQRYGYGLSAYVHLKIAQPAWKLLRARLMTIPEVEH